MQNICLSKIAGERYYAHHTFKVYEARRNGEVVGTVAQHLWDKWVW